MKWGKMPYTNLAGERCTKFKLEGHEFFIVGDRYGVKISGESPTFQTQEDLQQLAKAIGEAHQISQFYRKAEIGGINAVQVKGPASLGTHGSGKEIIGVGESEGV